MFIKRISNLDAYTSSYPQSENNPQKSKLNLSSDTVSFGKKSAMPIKDAAVKFSRKHGVEISPEIMACYNKLALSIEGIEKSVMEKNYVSTFKKLENGDYTITLLENSKNLQKEGLILTISKNKVYVDDISVGPENQILNSFRRKFKTDEEKRNLNALLTVNYARY